MGIIIRHFRSHATPELCNRSDGDYYKKSKNKPCLLVFDPTGTPVQDSSALWRVGCIAHRGLADAIFPSWSSHCSGGDLGRSYRRHENAWATSGMFRSPNPSRLCEPFPSPSRRQASCREGVLDGPNRESTRVRFCITSDTLLGLA